MGVEVAWVTEGREQKQLVGDSYGTISRLATSRWPKLVETGCLRFIDAFGDTVFNQAQLPVLCAEIKTELDFQNSQRDREHLEKIIKLIEVAMGNVHTYIIFIGD